MNPDSLGLIVDSLMSLLPAPDNISTADWAFRAMLIGLLSANALLVRTVTSRLGDIATSVGKLAERVSHLEGALESSGLFRERKS